MTNMTNPKVSVIMPIYNAEKFVEGAIKSVLEQDYRDYELIILDNASDDGTRECIEKFKDPRIRKIFHNTNIGMVDNFNYGINLSRGEFGVILCSDDYFCDGFLSKSIANHGNSSCLTFTNSRIHRGENISIYENVFSGSKRVTKFNLALHLHGVPLSSLMFPLKIKKELFDKRLPFNCDLEFIFRQMILNNLDLKFIDEPLVGVNLHDANQTLNYDITNENLKLLGIVQSYTPFGFLKLFLNFRSKRLLKCV